MIYNVHYVITKGSDDKTLVKGDHIFLDEDNHMYCIEAHGWLQGDSIKEAMKGLEWEMDRDWWIRESEKCEERFRWLNGLVS